MTAQKKAPPGEGGKLTLKQEAFAQAYIETGNASEAYRRAYNAENMAQNSIAVQACKMLNIPKIALRVDELRANAQERHEVTVDSLIRELEEARIAASTAERPQASPPGPPCTRSAGVQASPGTAAAEGAPGPP